MTVGDVQVCPSSVVNGYAFTADDVMIYGCSTLVFVRGFGTAGGFYR